MTGTSTRKFAFIGAAATLIGAAALLWVVVASPQPTSSAALGAEWQCTRTAFIWTSCSRIRSTETTGAVAQSARKDTPCPPRRGLNG